MAQSPSNGAGNNGAGAPAEAEAGPGLDLEDFRSAFTTRTVSEDIVDSFGHWPGPCLPVTALVIVTTTAVVLLS